MSMHQTQSWFGSIDGLGWVRLRWVGLSLSIICLLNRRTAPLCWMIMALSRILLSTYSPHSDTVCNILRQLQCNQLHFTYSYCIHVIKDNVRVWRLVGLGFVNWTHKHVWQLSLTVKLLAASKWRMTKVNNRMLAYFWKRFPQTFWYW